MSKSYGSALVVLIAPLLLAVGCVNAPIRPPQLGIDLPSQETATGAKGSSAIAASVVEQTPQAADQTATYFDETDGSRDLVAVDVEADRSAAVAVIAPSLSELAASIFESSEYYHQSGESQSLVAVALETNGTDEATEEAVVPVSPVALPPVTDAPPDIATAQPELAAEPTEIVGSSILAATAIELDGVEFASAAALKQLEILQEKEMPNAASDATLESSDVVQAGCRLFYENPPLRRECIDLGLGTISSIIHPCGMKYLAPYVDRVPQFDDAPLSATMSQNDGSCPPAAWWEEHVVRPARPESTSIPLSIESLLVRTLANSKYLQALADLPLIREKSTMEAIAEFDVSTFVESRFRRPSDPVGNQLTVGPGGSQRFRENDFATSAGVFRKTSRGGRVHFAQEIGMLNNNSTFIDPPHQGNTQLTLNITQPLLSGAGKVYNTSVIMLAQMDERVAWDEVSEQLQDYLVEVTENYWQLYLERARFEQKVRHLERGEAILSELEQRREIDAVENQIARARAAVQTRRTDLIRAKTRIRNIESQLRGLVNDPQLYGSAIEIVPAEIPQCTPLHLSLGDAMSQALKSRSEIDKAIQKVRAAGVRLSVAKKELLPILDVVLETYLSGLQGGNDIGQAWVDQFSVGEPSYSAGIRYEIPLSNRLAKNRHQRRRLEMRQAISQFEFEVEGLMSEVDIAVREVNTTYEEMLSRHEAMVASEIDLAYFHKRWELVPGEDRSASFLLEDILEAQDRVIVQESNFAQAQVDYAMSIVDLKRALGILMQSERIESGRTCEGGLEKYIFSKNQAAAVPVSDVITTTTMDLAIPQLHTDLIHSDQVRTDQTPDWQTPQPPMDHSSIELSGNGVQLHPIEAPVAVESFESLPLPAPDAPAR